MYLLNSRSVLKMDLHHWRRLRCFPWWGNRAGGLCWCSGLWSYHTPHTIYYIILYYYTIYNTPSTLHPTPSTVLLLVHSYIQYNNIIYKSIIILYTIYYHTISLYIVILLYYIILHYILYNITIYIITVYYYNILYFIIIFISNIIYYKTVLYIIF